MLKGSLNSLKKVLKKELSITFANQIYPVSKLFLSFSPLAFIKRILSLLPYMIYHSYRFIAMYAHVIRQLRTQIEINRDKHWVHLLVVVAGGFFFLVAVTKKVTKNPKCAERGDGSLF